MQPLFVQEDPILACQLALPGPNTSAFVSTSILCALA